MGRKYGLLHRAKISWYLLTSKSNKNMRTMTCGNCGSINIAEVKKEKFETIDKDENVLYKWEDAVQCQECGAVCMEYQIWLWDKK